MIRCHFPYYLYFLFVLVNFLPATAQQTANSSRAQQLRAELFDAQSHKIFVVAHRADWRNYPENSIGAIRSAIAMGVDVLELDVQRSSDGVLVLMHDARLDRTTSGKGKVSETDYAAIKELRLRNGAGVITREHI